MCPVSIRPRIEASYRRPFSARMNSLLQNGENDCQFRPFPVNSLAASTLPTGGYATVGIDLRECWAGRSVLGGVNYPTSLCKTHCAKRQRGCTTLRDRGAHACAESGFPNRLESKNMASKCRARTAVSNAEVEELRQPVTDRDSARIRTWISLCSNKLS